MPAADGQIQGVGAYSEEPGVDTHITRDAQINKNAGLDRGTYAPDPYVCTAVPKRLGCAGCYAPRIYLPPPSAPHAIHVCIISRYESFRKATKNRPPVASMHAPQRLLRLLRRAVVLRQQAGLAACPRLPQAGPAARGGSLRTVTAAVTAAPPPVPLPEACPGCGVRLQTSDPDLPGWGRSAALPRPARLTRRSASCRCPSG
jgi:hypothetical protein